MSSLKKTVNFKPRENEMPSKNKTDKMRDLWRVAGMHFEKFFTVDSVERLPQLCMNCIFTCGLKITFVLFF